ncbi:MAG TPA: hypothetical protein VMV47_09275 [Bacteroidales bacterium]|nr:hypothetical protein [Bacteroidales bacterium]
MKNSISLFKGIIITVVLFAFLKVYGQNSDCKVLMPQISGTYAGECKKGLAHGKGVATGIDRYEGQFRQGLPNGNGTYTWSAGNVYTGEWSKGLKEGKGKMINFTARGDSVVEGYWKGDSYAGKVLVPPYVIVRKDELLGYNLRKIGGDDIVIIKFMLKGQINTRMNNLQMSYTSGTRFKSGTYEGLQSVRYPLDLKITYTTSNPLSRSSFDVVFECTINEAGKWEITLNN